MSATGRKRADGAETVREKDDDYATPAFCVRSIWPHVRPIGGTILEPCAGSGAIVRELQRLGWRDLAAREINHDRYMKLINPSPGTCIECDWLAHDEKLRPSLILTNVPFKLALEFAKKAVKHQQPHQGTTCLLLRLNWLGSGKQDGRSAWLVDHMPAVFVLPKRPSFTGELRWTGERCAIVLETQLGRSKRCEREAGHDGEHMLCGGTDATEYAWMVWGPRFRNTIQILEVRQ